MGSLLGKLRKKSRVSFTMCPLGTSAITFKIYSLHTQWVCDGHIDSVPTMNSPCTHWVNDPSSPVRIEIIADRGVGKIGEIPLSDAKYREDVKGRQETT